MAQNITFHVTDESNFPIQNASITIDTLTVLTDVSGTALFSLEPAIGISYEITATNFNTINSTFDVIDVDITIPITMTETIPIPDLTYSVTFNVLDEMNLPLENVSVTFNSITVLSDALGVASFTNIPIANDYAYEIANVGYVSQTGLISVVDEDIVMDIVLVEETPWIPLQTYNYTITKNAVDCNLPTGLQIVKTDFRSIALDVNLIDGSKVNKIPFDLSGKFIKGNFKLPDKSFVLKDAEILNGMTGLCRFVISEDLLVNIGQCVCEIQMFDSAVGGNRLTVGKFNYNIVSSMM